MNTYYCETCDIQLDSAYNLKRHLGTEKHTDAVHNKILYINCFKKLQYLRAKELNSSNINDFKKSIVFWRMPLEQYNLKLLDTSLSENLKIEIEDVPSMINIKNNVCIMCGQNFMNQVATKTDIYLKKFAEHCMVCIKRHTYNELSASDIIDSQTMLEYCKTLQNNLLELIDTHTKKLDYLTDVQSKYYGLESERNTLRDERNALRIEHNELRNKYESLHTDYNALINERNTLTKDNINLLEKNTKLKTKCHSLKEQHTDTLISQLNEKDKTINIIKEIKTPQTPSKVNNIQIINMGNSYNFVAQNFPTAPNVPRITHDVLKNWYEVTKLPLSIKENPQANYIKCLGTRECKERCSLGNNCMGNYSLEQILVNNFDENKCSKKKKIVDGKEVVMHNKCPGSIEYSKFLGSIIVGCYKKDKPENQSLWNADTARYSYIIKMINNNMSQWEQDKSGLKTKIHVIEPLIACVRDLLNDYANVVLKSNLALIKKYIRCTMQARIKQISEHDRKLKELMVEYSKKNQNKNKNKNKVPTIENQDIKRKYDFEYVNDINDIDDMIINNKPDSELCDIVISCNDYNANNDQQHKMTEHNNCYQEHINIHNRIKKIIEHIEDKQFSSIIVRDIAPQFFLCKNIINNVSGKNLINDKSKVIVTEVE